MEKNEMTLSKDLRCVRGGLLEAEKYLCEDLDAICDDTMKSYAENCLARVKKALNTIDRVLDKAGNLKVFLVCVEEDGFAGLSTEAKVFANSQEAWSYAEMKRVEFVREEDIDGGVETDIHEGSIYSFINDRYIYITIEEHVI